MEILLAIHAPLTKVGTDGEVERVAGDLLLWLDQLYVSELGLAKVLRPSWAKTFTLREARRAVVGYPAGSSMPAPSARVVSFL